MTGNLTDATLASTNPSGYLIGEGCSRKAYLINGVVYKVETNPDSDCADNLVELFNAEMLAGKLPTNVRIPEMSSYRINDRIIIAMEYVTGILTGECSDKWLGLPCSHDDNSCLDPVLLETLTAIGWLDPTWGNAILSDGTVYLIDVA